MNIESRAHRPQKLNGPKSPDNRTLRTPLGQETAKTSRPGTPLYIINLPRLEGAIGKIHELFLEQQNAEGYWVFDLEADSTIPAEYVLLQRFLGRKIDKELKIRFATYLRSKQLPDGGWPLFEDGHADISASVKAYFALKILGESHNASHMVRARQLILSMGGPVRVNVFTRFTLALFGQIPWHTPPAMPVEIMLLPRWFFFHLNKVSYWSRTVIVPLLILYAKQAVCRLRPEECVTELFTTPPSRRPAGPALKPARASRALAPWAP